VAAVEAFGSPSHPAAPSVLWGHFPLSFRGKLHKGERGKKNPYPRSFLRMKSGKPNKFFHMPNYLTPHMQRTAVL